MFVAKNINIAKAIVGIDQIRVHGACNSAKRQVVLEEAIAYIQENGPDWYTERRSCFGTKNYAHWTDQRCDCQVGMGPKHGSICFSIGPGKESFDEEGIYLLLLVAENKDVDVTKLLKNLIEVQHEVDLVQEDIDKLKEFKE